MMKAPAKAQTLWKTFPAMEEPTDTSCHVHRIDFLVNKNGGCEQYSATLISIRLISIRASVTILQVTLPVLRTVTHKYMFIKGH